MPSEVSFPSKTRVMSIDLTRPVISLADNISTSMSALYSLHAALYSVYEESSPEVLKFIDLKRKIASDWEQWASFLQHCMGFARDYVTVCHSLQSDNFVEHIASAGAILMSSQRIRREMANKKLAYGGLVREFSSLATGFHRDFLDANSRVNSAAAPGQRLRIFQDTPHRGIIEAYAASVRALEESNTSIRDMAVFWEDHVTLLSKLAGSGNVIGTLNQELYFQREIATWTSFHDTLFRAVESILSSCDASAVAPVNQSHQWKKLIGRVRPKRRLSPGGLAPSSEPNSSPSGVSSSEPTVSESPQILTNPSKFDVQNITKTMSTVHACFRALLVRDTLRRNFRKGRFRVKDRLLAQISAYIDSLPVVDEVASLGEETCQSIQKLLLAQDKPNIANGIHDLALRVSELTRTTLMRYEMIYPVLHAEIAMRKSRKSSNMSPLPQEDTLLQDPDSVPSRALLAYTGDMVKQLIQEQQQFHLYWSHLALDTEHFDGKIAAGIKELSDGWRIQEQCLRAYGDEARDAKQLRNANYAPSKPNWLRSLKGLGRARRTTVDEVDTVASKISLQD